jgi:hypothetical protein
MPKLVKEITQGSGFGRSAEGGAVADTATRVYRVVLNAPNEVFNIFEVTGVSIGDPYLSGVNEIPCVSMDCKVDGESRLVRIITATYQSQAGGDGLEDPRLLMPDVRPANFSTSTSLYEAPAYKWKEFPGGGGFEAVANVLGDPIDGITRMEAITTIRVTQFSTEPGTVHSMHCGKINSETMNLGSYMSCAPHTVLFKGVEAQPHVESFGTLVVRGFINSYEFAYRPNKVDGLGECGWDATPLHTGFNVKAFAPPGLAEVDVFGQPLKYKDYELVNPLALPDGVAVGDKVRAMVKIVNFENGKVTQSPSAQPVALNQDGTPRDTKVTIPKVLILRRQVQDEIDLTQTLQLRLQ